MTLPRTLPPVIAVISALLFADVGTAQSVVPSDNAGGGAYLPSVAGAGGRTPEDDLGNRRTGAALAPTAIRRKFEARGPDGVAAAALAEATAPPPASGQTLESDRVTLSFAPLGLAAVSLAAEATGPLLPRPPAEAERPLGLGFVADQFGGNLLTNADPDLRGRWWNRLLATNANLVRVNLYWNQVAGSEPPAQPADPDDPTYDWTIPDSAVREAEVRGLEVVFTVVGAPRWAEGADPPPEDSYRVGSWKPDPAQFGEFAAAAASRYSGTFDDLPRVRYWEAWNEPNIPQYLAPQWSGREPRSPDLYRGLLNSFYAAVKAVDRSNVVIAAGTSPFGDQPGGVRMRPYVFWRELLCLEDGSLAAQSDESCAKGSGRAHMDIYAHHPINAVPRSGPTSPPPHRDDGVPSNFGELVSIVRSAERQGTILPTDRERPGWATELWYESNPPEPKAVNLATQARFMQQAMRVLWEQGAEATFFLQLQDAEYDPTTPALVGFQTGVYLPDDSPKPSLRAVRFPFVAERISDAEVLLWGRAPRSGVLSVSDVRRGAKLAKFTVRRGGVFERTVDLSDAGDGLKLRAEVGGQRSLPWSVE